MSGQLQKTEFTEALLDNEYAREQIASFTCGAEVWEAEVSDWLKKTKGEGGAVDASLQDGTTVWLYWTAARELVGYGCIGPGHLRWPNPNKSPQILSTAIPMLGVAQTLQGQGYGKEILMDLLAVARTWAKERCIVVLSVHEKNPGVGLYTGRNFRPFGKPRPLPPNGDLYQRYVLDLGGEPPPSG